MDMSCPSCHVDIQPTEAKKANRFKQLDAGRPWFGFACPHCNARIAYSGEHMHNSLGFLCGFWLPLFIVFEMYFFNHSTLTVTQKYIVILACAALLMIVRHYLEQYLFNKSTAHYWKRIPE